MASSLHNLSEYNKDLIPNAEKFKFGIVVSEWNDSITFALRDGCLEALQNHGTLLENIEIIYVPGSFELTAGAKFLVSNGSFDAVICLGCVIKGETPHNDYINQAVATGLTNLGMMSNTPCIFGLLTPNNEEQAKERAGGKHGNKGVEAAITAIKMAQLKQKYKTSKSPIGFN